MQQYGLLSVWSVPTARTVIWSRVPPTRDSTPSRCVITLGEFLILALCRDDSFVHKSEASEHEYILSGVLVWFRSPLG
jgi:hypothetical protein